MNHGGRLLKHGAWSVDPGRWTAGLDEEGARAVSVLAAGTSAADGVAPLSGHVLDALFTGQNHFLLVGADGAPAGVAVAHDDDPVELFVAPGFRRAGLGRLLLTAALARSGAVWSHGDLLPARRLAEEFELARVRELIQMRRPLNLAWAQGEVAAAPPPQGVRFRTFVPGRDEQQFLAVNARAFAWHPEQGRLDLAGLRLEMSQPWFDPAGFFLAVDAADTVLGFHWTKVHTGLPEPIGEVFVLGVDPDARLRGEPVRGLGGPLTALGLAHLALSGLRSVLLYVEGDNEKALRLYRRLGFAVHSTDVVYRHPD